MEMKLEQKLKIILLILIIILISLMSFGGLFIQKNGRMANLLPEYIKGMDLKGNRYITFEVVDDTEESTEQGKEETTEETEKESVNTKENFIKARKIIEKRLKEMKTDEVKMIIRMNFFFNENIGTSLEIQKKIFSLIQFIPYQKQNQYKKFH